MNTSTFFITLSDDEKPDMNKKHTIFGEVAEGLDVLEKLNQVHVSEETNRPLQKIKIKHTVVIDEGPFEEDGQGKAGSIERLIPSRSPSPARSMIDDDDQISDDIDIDDVV